MNVEAYAAKVTHEHGVFRLEIRDHEKALVASHSGTARQMQNLAMGLEVKAQESRDGDDSPVVIMDGDGSGTGTRLELDAESLEAIANLIRAKLVEVAGEIKLKRTADRLAPFIDRTTPTVV